MVILEATDRFVLLDYDRIDFGGRRRHHHSCNEIRCRKGRGSPVLSMLPSYTPVKATSIIPHKNDSKVVVSPFIHSSPGRFHSQLFESHVLLSTLLFQISKPNSSHQGGRTCNLLGLLLKQTGNGTVSCKPEKLSSAWIVDIREGCDYNVSWSFLDC